MMAATKKYIMVCQQQWIETWPKVYLGSTL